MANPRRRVWVLAGFWPGSFAHQTALGTMLTTPALANATTFATAHQADMVKARYPDRYAGLFAFPVPAALFEGRDYDEGADYEWRGGVALDTRELGGES